MLGIPCMIWFTTFDWLNEINNLYYMFLQQRCNGTVMKYEFSLRVLFLTTAFVNELFVLQFTEVEWMGCSSSIVQFIGLLLSSPCGSNNVEVQDWIWLSFVLLGCITKYHLNISQQHLWLAENNSDSSSISSTNENHIYSNTIEVPEGLKQKWEILT